MPREPQKDSKAFISEICWHYYINGLTQADVARNMGVTRLRVNQAIQKAKASGMVQIEVGSPFIIRLEIQQRLEQKLGIKKALSHGSKFDVVSSAIVFMAYSIPGWAFGGVLLVLFGGGSFWDVFPLGGLHSPQEIWQNLSFFEKGLDQIHHIILPIIAWTITSFATLTILMKNSLLENLSQDYVRTAFAKGLSERRVIWVHTVRNSIIPIASGIGYIIATFITGSYFIEMIFNINGFGKMGFQAILDRDYPITMGFLVIVVIMRLIANLLSDLTLAAVDPRIRFK